MAIKDNLVIKANNLIEGFMGMSHNEYKLTLYLVSKIKKNDEKFRIQRVSVAEFSELIECNKNNLYAYIKSLSVSLLTKKISVLYKNGDRLAINWFSYTKYLKNIGVLEVAFNNDLSPFLLKLDREFTKFFLSNIRLMKSRYSVRIYELLKQYEKVGSRVITIEDLRLYLGIEPDEYRQYNDFKRRVILMAQKELKEFSDICFEFEELKNSRKIEAIEFTIERNHPNKNICYTSLFNNQIENEKDENEELKGVIKEFNAKYNGNLDPILTKNLIKMKGIDCVRKCVKEFECFVTNANEVEKIFYDFTKKYATEKAYTKSTSFHNAKPIQATNYEQREYSDEYFNSLYDNVKFIK